jgi:hypothetical protein
MKQSLVAAWLHNLRSASNLFFLFHISAISGVAMSTEQAKAIYPHNDSFFRPPSPFAFILM